MSDEREIWISAQKMIDRYGQDALSQINHRIEELRDSEEARALWIRIRDAAEALQQHKGPGSHH